MIVQSDQMCMSAGWSQWSCTLMLRRASVILQGYYAFWFCAVILHSSFAHWTGWVHNHCSESFFKMITMQDHSAGSQYRIICKITVQNKCEILPCRITAQNHCAESSCRIIMENLCAESLQDDQCDAEVILHGGSAQQFNALSFYGSKMILDHPNCFGRVQIIMIRSKSFWIGPNYEKLVQKSLI